MAKIVTYCPTEGVADRGHKSLYAAIMNWVQSLPVFSKWFDITYSPITSGSTLTEYKIHFVPKAANLTAFVMDIVVTSNNIILRANHTAGSTGSTNTVSISFTNTAAEDVKFYVYDGEDAFSIGMYNANVAYAIVPATSFADNTKGYASILTYSANSNYYMNICLSGTTYLWHTNADYNKVSGGICGVYRIQPMPIPGTDKVFNNVYYFDGGMSNPPIGMFKVEDDVYCTLKNNVALKLV